MNGFSRLAPDRGKAPAEVMLVALALVASAAAIWLVTGEKTVALAYGGGLMVLGGIAWTLARMPAKRVEADGAVPDWTVTAAAIEQAGVAIAVTDRASRLTCANSDFAAAFGTSHAPPGLPLDHAGAEALTRVARGAWRDGSAALDLLESGTSRWAVSATRAGRADDYLVWRFEPLIEHDQMAEIAQRITGAFGRVLSHAGIEAAVVGPEGVIRTVSEGFALRAAGDPRATLAGQELTALLRSDERDRIYFAREGRKGVPQTLVHVALVEPDEQDTAPDHAPSLMFLLDAGVGIGGTWGTETQTGTPQLQALLEQLPLGLAMTDRDGHFLFANPAFLRAAGLEGKPLPPYPLDLVVKEDKGAMSDAVRRFGQGAPSSADMAVRLRSSPDEPVSLGIAGVRGLGEPAVLLSLADTTEETRLKRQVAQASKMQAVGQLAGGVAHDFNNVLTAIIGYCDLMLLRHTPGDSDYDDIQQIKANSNRAASLTRQLLAFSRQQTLRPEVLQLPDVIAEVSQLLKRLMGERIELNIHHDRNLGPVRADPQQLEQVMMNLAVNARDAIQRTGETTPGRLTIVTRRVAAADVRRMDSEVVPVGDYTVLIVEDTGGGIPPEVLPKIFDPFFTTKEMGKGTGLGLSTVYGIIKQSGGFIFCDNVAEGALVKGARFTIYLPVHSAAEPVALRGEKEEASHWSGGGRILLVEDEDMVRAVAERALTRQGYDVVTAADGEEGLEKVAQGGIFDLVVSDVVMPNMDGPAMARELRRIAPGLPVLFMSGYAEEQLRNEIDIEDMHFIPKPFSVQQIANKVAEVLGVSKG
ncbi:MAG: response regulator [Candidatus Andeanibacterium colombiense]|uniref:histidine kinase n=1 Tax=Candidatus Andeanibacterium colombiense TaxID=3121345 RepID=A0AAJ6BPN0_9SPHN|nr:MAG: response regulator [Sphingomonadaceae bacterium]